MGKNDNNKRKGGNVIIQPKQIVKRVRTADGLLFEGFYGIDEDNEDDDDDSLSNTCFSVRTPPIIVDYRTLAPIERAKLPNDWSKFSAANRAAKGIENIGRLMGYVTFECSNVNVAVLKEMMMATTDDESYSFNDDGEFNTPYGQITLGALMDAKDKIEFVDEDEANRMIEHLYGLQSPQSSQWGKPFIRLVSNHSYCQKKKTLSIRFYLYFTRLIFELIANEGVQYLLEKIEGSPYNIIPTKAKVHQPVMFKSDENKMYNTASYKFSLAGLLKYAENKGYAIGDLVQPPGLKLKLYEYQLSTLKWMLDKENDESDMGLNGEFWEEIQTNDELGNIYYFPIGGELRLQKPPRTTGGLLSEEMGLGKTIEILALILANQNKSNRHGLLDPTTQLRISKATLIVVPSTLSSQWWREIKSNINTDDTECVDFINISDQDKRIAISIENVRLVKDSARNMGYYKSKPYDQNDAAFDFGGEHIQMFCKHYARSIITNVFVEVRLPFSYAKMNCYVGKLMAIKNNAADIVEILFDYEDLIWDHDVILTTYESLKKYASFYKKILFHRIILDECQEIKVATTALALQLGNIKSVHRYNSYHYIIIIV